MVSKHFVLGRAEKTRLRAEVMKILERHHGKENAITGKSMAMALCMRDDRKIRVTIDELIGEGVAIAASVGDPAGFYIVGTEHEAFEYIRVLKGRRDEISHRLEAFKRAVGKTDMTVPEQGSMSLKVGNKRGGINND